MADDGVRLELAQLVPPVALLELTYFLAVEARLVQERGEEGGGGSGHAENNNTGYRIMVVEGRVEGRVI